MESWKYKNFHPFIRLNLHLFRALRNIGIISSAAQIMELKAQKPLSGNEKSGQY